MIRFLERYILILLASAALALPCADAAQLRLARELTRIQIIAHSDTAEDQALKYAVRDAVTVLSEAVTGHCTDAREAEACLRQALPDIRDHAQRTVYGQHRVTPVEVSLETVYYPTRDYGCFRLPAGEYRALRLVLGSGEGQNWWCVAFPSLCSAGTAFDQAASGLSADALTLIRDGETLHLRFWLVDLAARMKQMLFS